MSESLVGPPAASERLLVLLEPGRDRDLLAEWLAAVPGYEVSVADPGADLSSRADTDLCIVDDTTLARRQADLRAFKERAAPVVRPLLLVTSGTSAGSMGSGHDEATHQLVDDIVTLPVDQPVLRRRLRALLRSRRAFLRLSERTQQYEELVEMTPEALLVVREGEILYSNATAAEVFDVPEAERRERGAALAGRSLSTLAEGAAWEELSALLTRVEQGEDTATFHSLSMRTVSGAVVETEVAGVTVTYEGAPATQLLVRDVTSERRRQQRLDLFGRAIEAVRQGVTIADARQDGYPLIYANDAFERITGYTTPEILGQSCRFLQGDRTDEATVDTIRAALDAREPVSVELLNYRRDGTPFWNQLDIVPVTDDSGTVTHFLGLQRDVTERTARKERLQVMARVLRHNLRNQMNVIVGHAERLQAADQPDTEAVGERIVAACTDLLETSNRIQDFRGLIAGDDRPSETYDLVAHLTAVAERFRQTHPEATVTLDLLETATATGHPLLPTALSELFAVPTGGEGVVEFTVAVRPDGNRWVLELRDDGGTIPASDLTAIERAAETPTDHPQGIELWLVRWATLYSGGEVVVTRGATPRVELRIPRADRTADGDESEQRDRDGPE